MGVATSAHDGPEYGEYSKLMMMLDAMTASGELPPMSLLQETWT